jgi:hypothetical protein
MMADTNEHPDQAAGPVPESPWRPKGFVFYPADWIGDSRLMMCGETAQFLWFRLMGLAWQSPEPGRLLRADGQPMTIVQAARLLGTDPARATDDFAELLANQVAHQDAAGVIFCPRLLRDYERAAKTRAARARGGVHGHKGRDFGEQGAEAGRLFGRGHTTPRADTPAVAPRPAAGANGKPRTTSRREAAAECPIDPGEVWAAWNAMAAAAGVPAAMKLTDARRKTILARAADPFWLEHWREALERIEGSSFCRGSKGWTAKFDWFLKQDSVTKLVEGNYEDDRPAQPVNGKPLADYYAKLTAKAMDD